MDSGLVYVVHNDWIQNPKAKEEGCKTYKIGITAKTVEDRYYGLGLKMPCEFEVDFAYEFGDGKFKKIEQLLQGLLNQSRKGGEWFDLNPTTLDGIKSTCEEFGGKLVSKYVKDEIREEEDEPDDSTQETWTREMWEGRSKWSVETADSLFEVISGAGVFEKPDLRFKRSRCIDITFSTKRCIRICKNRKTSSMYFPLDSGKKGEVKALLDKNNISCTLPEGDGMRILPIDKRIVEQHKDVFVEIAKLIRDFMTQA